MEIDQASFKLNSDAIKFYETVSPNSTNVIEVANSWTGGGYVWGTGTGLGIPLMWTNPKTGKEEVLKDKQDKGTYCSGYVLQVAYIVAKNRLILQNKTKSQLLTFIKEWYQSSPKTCVTAIINLGIGHEIKLEDAIEGDFCQLWRTNNSGHNVIFKKFLYKDKKIIGIEYRSTQKKTNGIGDNTEYFIAGGGTIKKDSTYFVRLTI